MAEALGKMHKTASGHLSYEIEHFEAEQIFAVATRIQEEFHIQPGELPIVGLDSAMLEMIIQGTKVIIGWDNWSGLFVMATDEAGDQWVDKIAGYLESIAFELEQSPDDSAE